MQNTPKPSKKSAQVSVRLDPKTFATLEAINARHGLEPVAIARRLLEAAAQFYEVHGYFTFPVRIWPEAEFLTQVLQTGETPVDRARLAKSEAARKAKDQS